MSVTSSPPTTAPPTSPPTTSPTAAPAPATTPAPSGTSVPSPAGIINVAVCIASGMATVTLEKQVTRMSPWNGTSFPPVVFPAFNTPSNSYPAYTVYGNLSGAGIMVTVMDGGNQSAFLIGNGAASDCVVA